MPKKKKKSKVKRRSKRINKKIKKKVKSNKKKFKRIKKVDSSAPSELIFKNKPEWIKSSLANKAQYQKKYNDSIKNKVKITVTIDALNAAPKSKVIKWVIGGGAETTPLKFAKPVIQAIALKATIPIIIFPLILNFSMTIIEMNAPAPSNNNGLDKSPN